MAIAPMTYIDQPYAGRRYTPDSSRLAALYQQGGAQLANLALQRGQNSARLFDRLGALFSGYQDVEQQKKATAAATALRKQEKAEERSFSVEQQRLEREERAAERKADKDARQKEIDGAAAIRKAEKDEAALTGTVEATRPGVVHPALFEQVKRLSPALAARFQVQDGVPVLMQTPAQLRQAEVDKATAADRAAAAEDRKADNIRADKQLAATIAAGQQRQKPDQKFVIRNGAVVPILEGQAQPGDVPYSADAMQGVGGDASDARAQRTAAALNSIDVLKELAPKRLDGPVGMVQGAMESAKGAIGYNTGVKQYNALLGPTAMQMAVAIQGAAGLSNAEREVTKGMLGSISTMDYQSQMALLERASELVRNGADVALVDVVDPKTKQPKKMWRPMRSRMPGSVQLGDGTIPGVTPSAAPPSDPAGLFPKPKG